MLRLSSRLRGAGEFTHDATAPSAILIGALLNLVSGQTGLALAVAVIFVGLTYRWGIQQTSVAMSWS
jgi:hypothetical protein